MAKKIIFIDRDGTIIREPDDYCVNSLEKLSFLPGVISALRTITQLGYELVMVTNQDGLGTEAFPQETFDGPQNKMLEILAGEGVRFLEICVDEHYPEDNHPNRKPNPGMAEPVFKKYEIDKANSFMIGDRKTDAQFAANIGVQSLTIKDPGSHDGDLRCPEAPVMPTRTFFHWSQIARYFRGK